MKNNFLKKIKTNRQLRWYITACISFIFNVAFLIYNFILGLVYKLVWNFSVSFYYLLLTIIKPIILYSEKKWTKHDKDTLSIKRSELFMFNTIFLMFIDFILIAPIVLMLLDKRIVHFGEIPTIAIATYTTYKIIMACINFNKSKSVNNSSLESLKSISLKEAIVSTITLQNTMIVVFGDYKDMLPLAAITSSLMLIGMMTLSIIQFIKSKKFFMHRHN